MLTIYTILYNCFNIWTLYAAFAEHKMLQSPEAWFKIENVNFMYIFYREFTTQTKHYYFLPNFWLRGGPGLPSAAYMLWAWRHLYTVCYRITPYAAWSSQNLNLEQPRGRWSRYFWTTDPVSDPGSRSTYEHQWSICCIVVAQMLQSQGAISFLVHVWTPHAAFVVRQMLSAQVAFATLSEQGLICRSLL